MKRLFNEDKGECETEDGRNLANETSKVITPLVENYMAMGYSIRDIEYIMHSEVSIVCLSRAIGWA